MLKKLREKIKEGSFVVGTKAQTMWVVKRDIALTLLDEQQDKIEERINGIMKYLREKHPSITQEQYHLNKGTMERYYWHYGYLMALNDVLGLHSVVGEE